MVLKLHEKRLDFAPGFEKGEPFIYKWSTGEEGKYAFQAFAYDNSGHKSNTGPVVINIIKEKTVGGKHVFSSEEKKLHK